MIQTLIGQKIDQTQKFLENGKRIPVTEVAISDNVIVQVKTVEKDTYSSVQLGWGQTKNALKPAMGHSKKANLEKAPKVLREVRLADDATVPELGSSITLEAVFKPGDIIDVSGVSKGKGFAGGVKRYNFRGGPKTHGQSDRHRAPGSIGQGTTPGRVYKGKKMAGHMGAENVTVRNVQVIEVDAENKKLYVMGLLPGAKKSVVVLTVRGENKKFVPLLKLEEEKPVMKEEARETIADEHKTEDVSSEVKISDVQEKAAKEETKAEVKEEKVAEVTEEKAEKKE